MKSKKSKKQDYFSPLPNHIMFSDDLTHFQKLLYIDIYQIYIEMGYCRASNNFLAVRHKMSMHHISKQISALVKHGHISILNTKSGREIVPKLPE